MKSLVLPPNGGWAVKAKFDFFEGGFFDGVPGFTLELSGLAFGSERSSEKADPVRFMKGFIQEITNMEKPANCILRVTGKIPPHDPMLASIVRYLKPLGISLHLVLDESNFMTDAVSLASWVIWRSSSPEALVPANEIWYEPLEAQDLGTAYSHVPEVGRMVRYYLRATGKRDLQEIITFICSRPEVWALMH